MNNKIELRKFGLTLTAGFMVFGLLLLLRGKSNYLLFIELSAVLFIISIIYPYILKYIYKPWILLGVFMGKVMTTVILSILFYFILTPMSIVMRLLKNNFLELKIDKKAKSYWKTKDNSLYKKDSLEKQY